MDQQTVGEEYIHILRRRWRGAAAAALRRQSSVFSDRRGTVAHVGVLQRQFHGGQAFLAPAS